jgi:hypothetical protein
MGAGPVSKTTDDLNRSIVWLDASSKNTDEYIHARKSLHTSTNHLKTYTDEKACEEYILSVPKEHQIILIVDDKLGQVIVPRIHQFIQVSAIFVHLTNKKNESWTKKYNKVNQFLLNQFYSVLFTFQIKDVSEYLDELVIQALSAQEKQSSFDRFEEPLLISIYKTSSSPRQSPAEQFNDQFIASQKMIYSILRRKPTATDRNELITYCKREYANNKKQLDIIREFQQDYSADSAVKWYTRDCFLYKLLNKALHMRNTELLYRFGFFIRDLHRQLKQTQCSKTIHVYRGELMPKEQVQQLKHSVGQLISINSFLSTTIDREVAVIFSGDTEATKTDVQPVLFEIEADPRAAGVKPFGDISSFTYMSNEKEVMMMLGSIFRLRQIHYDGSLCIIDLVLCGNNDRDIKPISDQIQMDNNGKGNASPGVHANVPTQMGNVNEGNKNIRRKFIQAPSNHTTNRTNGIVLNLERVYNIFCHTLVCMLWRSHDFLLQ